MPVNPDFQKKRKKVGKEEGVPVLARQLRNLIIQKRALAAPILFIFIIH